MKNKELSVFFPSYNEEGNIESTVNRAVEVLQKIGIKYEILIINDGSKDNTKQVSENLAQKNSQIRVITHPKNLGYGEALKSGFYNAKYDTIVYTDGDGQFDFAEVTKFLEKIEDSDLVIGYRIKRQDPFLRRLFGKGWRFSLLAFFGLTLKDVDCGFKMVKRAILQKIPKLESQRGAMINAELAIKVKKYGFKIGQLGVNHYPRLSGRSTGASVAVIVKSYLDLVRLWWKLKDEKLLFVFLFLILSLAAFLRFYKLSAYMTFLGDEGRDALVIKDMLTNHHFPLIGPPTSVGNIYLGPLYYYMMAISMLIFWFNPISAAGMNALIGIVIVILIYYLGRVWFSRQAGLVASFLYAISPVTIIYSRSSWNPNPAPLFTLIAVWGFYKAHKEKNFRWLILTGASASAALQMHYLALIMLPTFALLWLFEVILNKPIRNLISGTALGIWAFILIISPLIWFDLRHNFLNYLAIIELLTQGNDINGNILLNFLRIPSIYSHNLIGRYLAGENPYLTLILSTLIILSLFKRNWINFCLGVWLGIGLLGLSFYQGAIYDHYLGFLNPSPFLLLGSLAAINYRTEFKKLISVALLILIIILTVVNLQKNPLKYPPNNQLERTQKVAKYIINQSGEKDFNFALIAKNNYDAAYQFYLGEFNHKPKQVPFDITSQLFVVCEDLPCDPTHSPKYEVAGFGWSKIEWQQDQFGVRIYKLGHNPSGKP